MYSWCCYFRGCLSFEYIWIHLIFSNKLYNLPELALCMSIAPPGVPELKYLEETTREIANLTRKIDLGRLLILERNPSNTSTQLMVAINWLQYIVDVLTAIAAWKLRSKILYKTEGRKSHHCKEVLRWSACQWMRVAILRLHGETMRVWI